MVKTQGIKYIGSKLKVLPRILNLAEGLDVNRVLDGFSGTTRVSQAFAKSNYTVVSNDFAEWSSYFATAYLKNQKPRLDYKGLIDHLNNLTPVDGWFTGVYGGDDFDGSAVQPDGLKKLWQRHNTMKLDAIRAEIDLLNLNEVTKAVALTSLVLALDKVDSTMGHFSSYLREWSPRSFNSLDLKVPELWINELDHEIYCDDIFEVFKKTEIDLAYLDPPYGSNNKNGSSRVRYLAYYHIWKTVVLNDEPDLFGKAARRQDTSDKAGNSEFEEFRKDEDGNFFVASLIDRMISQCPARYIIMSYSTNARIPISKIKPILQSYGSLIDTVSIDHPVHVMTNMKWSEQWVKDSEDNKEFLFLLEKE